jgi:D-inositol-3-phosphate glycosyltransferase
MARSGPPDEDRRPPLERAERISRLFRVAERTARNARRVAAAVRALGTPQYPGGVDPITADTIGTERATVVRGWALGAGDDLEAVVVLVDGHAVAVGGRDLTDPRAAAGVVPWRASVPLGPGRHVVGAVAVFRSGLARVLDDQAVPGLAASERPGTTATVAGAAPPAADDPPAADPRSPRDDGGAAVPQGYLEEPVDGTVVRSPLVTVSGWAAHDPIARIEIEHDGRVEAARQMARPRADVALQVRTAHSGFCGFEHVIDLTGTAAGSTVTVTARAVGLDGARSPIGASRIVIADAETGGPDEASEREPAPRRWVHDPVREAALRVRTDAITARHVPSSDGARIVAVTHDLGLGGGQLYLQELLLRLRDLAPDHAGLVISPSDGPLRDELEAAGIEVHVVGPYPTEPVPYESLLRHLAFIAGDFGATAVVVNTAGAMCGVDLAARIGVPALWAIHESYAPDQFLLAAFGPDGFHPSAQARLDAAVSSAAALIFEAEATRQLYAGAADPRRLLHIEYGVPVVTIEEHLAAVDRAGLRADQGWDERDVVLLCVGTLEPRKAQGSLLRAFARVASDHPEAVLVLVGDRGDHYGRELRTYAERLDLGDRIRIEPVGPDCYDWYACADAFVLASDLESLPRSVLEAMAFGLPVVVADVFGLSDLVDDGSSGVRFAPRDLAALEAALRAVLERTPDERCAMGARGAERVRADHDSRHYARAYRDLIDGFAADPTALPGRILAR